MEVAKFKKRLFCTGRKYYGLTFPKAICESLISRDVEITLLDSGVLIITPIDKELKTLVEGL